MSRLSREVAAWLSPCFLSWTKWGLGAFVWISMTGSAATATLTQPAIPEPGLFLLGRIHGAPKNNLSEIPAWQIEAHIADQSVVVEPEWIQLDQMDFFSIRIPFERTHLNGLSTTLPLNPTGKALHLANPNPVKLQIILKTLNPEFSPWFIQNDNSLTGDVVLDIQPSFRAQVIRADIEFQTSFGRENELAEWALKHFGDPNAMLDGDTDGDGLNDYEEFLAGTHPKDPTSQLVIGMIEVTTEGFFALRWQSVPGKQYQIERRQGVKGSPEIVFTQTAQESVGRFIDTHPPDKGGVTLYRVIVIP